MKEFIKGLLELIGAILVTIIIMPLGFVYSILYSLWLTVTLKDGLAFFKFWWRFFDGILSSIGYMFHSIAYGLDLMWNVNGEIIEDIITHEEHTEFSKKNVTVSASTGKLEIENKLNKRGKFMLKVLNVTFNQNQHAIDAWEYLVEMRKLKSNYFN